MSLVDTLSRCFGYSEFRPQQEHIVNTILLGKDILVLMPTGAGKSICYQLPALCEIGVSIIISPLISLMFDQVKDLEDRGIIAHRYDSTTKQSLSTIIDDIKNGSCNILYTTPETLTNNSNFLMELESLYNSDLLKRFIIDEANCVSNWGHDFRPSYLNLKMKTWFKNIQICAFTATATNLVSHDIIDNLSLDNPVIIKSSFIKENISYNFRNKVNDNWGYTAGTIAKIIKDDGYLHNTGIVYCLSRKECEFVAKSLVAKGISAQFYHARIDTTKKDKIQTDWLNGKTKVIVATIAFALGINKPDVRYVIHTSMPKSIETYYQQTGRAGRDGKPAKCITFYNEKDRTTLLKMVSNISSGENLVPPVRNTDRVNEMYVLCCNKNMCIKTQLSVYLGENLVRSSCENSEVKCGNCRKGLSGKNMHNLAKIILDSIGENLTLATLKRGKTNLEHALISHLLNDGYLITEIIDNKEFVSVVMEPESPYMV